MTPNIVIRIITVIALYGRVSTMRATFFFSGFILLLLLLLVPCFSTQGFSRKNPLHSYGFKNGLQGSDAPINRWLDEYVEGIPGVDYPAYDGIPAGLNFSCENFDYAGLFADVQSGCQVYHVCYGDSRRNYSFLCQDGTVFNQFYYACDWWYNVDCGQSPSYYAFNRINKPPLPFKPTAPLRLSTQRLRDFHRRRNSRIAKLASFGGRKSVSGKLSAERNDRVGDDRIANVGGPVEKRDRGSRKYGSGKLSTERNDHVGGRIANVGGPVEKQDRGSRKYGSGKLSTERNDVGGRIANVGGPVEKQDRGSRKSGSGKFSTERNDHVGGRIASVGGPVGKQVPKQTRGSRNSKKARLRRRQKSTSSKKDREVSYTKIGRHKVVRRVDDTEEECYCRCSCDVF